MNYYLMWALAVYLMHLTDYLHIRKYKMKCRLCGRVFNDKREVDIHIRTIINNWI